MKSVILVSFVYKSQSQSDPSVTFFVLKILKTVKILCFFCWVFHICICLGGCTMGRLGCDCFLIVLLIPCRHISRDATSPVISISLWSHRTCTAQPFLQGGVLLCLTLSYCVLRCLIVSYCWILGNTPFVFHPIQKMTGLGEAPANAPPCARLMHNIINWSNLRCHWCSRRIFSKHWDISHPAMSC